MNKIEHIAWAVHDLEASCQMLEKLLGITPYRREKLEAEGVTTVFFRVGEVKIELLGDAQPDSAVDRFLQKRGEGLHHIAFQVDNLSDETRRLDAEGFPFAGMPRAGAENMLIHFLHPKATAGALIELCQPQA